MDLENVGGVTAEPIAGISKIAWIAPHEDFTTIGEPADLETYAGTEETDLVTILAADTHTFPVDKGFTKIEMVTETGTLASSLLGNRKGRLFRNFITMELAGSSAKIKAFLRKIKNGDFIVLVEEVGSGNLVQLGSQRFPAHFTGIEAAIEALAEGKNSVVLTVEDKQKWPGAIYAGTVTEKPVAP